MGDASTDWRSLVEPDERARAAGAAFAALVALMARLRSPEGCPWDRAQTLASLRRYLIEEAYEVLDVMEGAPAPHRDELGDLLFQVLFQSQIRDETGAFSIRGVCDGLGTKLTGRHPHVFGDAPVPDAAGLRRNWEARKAQEAGGAKRRFGDGISPSLPALRQAERMQDKASAMGLDWPDVSGPLQKVDEELGELRAQIAGTSDAGAVEEELGDLLFAVVNVARHLGVSAEDALRAASRKFRDRVRFVASAMEEKGATALDEDELDRLWQAAKAKLG